MRKIVSTVIIFFFLISCNDLNLDDLPEILKLYEEKLGMEFEVIDSYSFPDGRIGAIISPKGRQWQHFHIRIHDESRFFTKDSVSELNLVWEPFRKLPVWEMENKINDILHFSNDINAIFHLGGYSSDGGAYYRYYVSNYAGKRNFKPEVNLDYYKNLYGYFYLLSTNDLVQVKKESIEALKIIQLEMLEHYPFVTNIGFSGFFVYSVDLDARKARESYNFKFHGSWGFKNSFESRYYNFKNYKSIRTSLNQVTTNIVNFDLREHKPIPLSR